MKKFFPVILAGVAAAVVLVGCLVWYHNAVPATDPDQQSLQTPEDNTDPVSDALFTPQTYPRVDASLAIHPLMDALAADFLDMPVEDLAFTYTSGRTSDVYRRLIDGEVDVIFAAEISEEDKAYAKDKGVELTILPATASAFVFIVNTENPVNGLTLAQIQDIYAGKITNWSQVGGNDAPILAYQRPTGSGSQTAMLSLVMKDIPMMTPPTEQISAEMGELVDAIAQYDNAKDALGYSYFYYVNTMYKRDTIKMLSVDGVAPTIETIKDGSYPIFTNGFIVLRADEAADSAVRKWVDAVLSERGSAVIEAEGYVPVN